MNRIGRGEVAELLEVSESFLLELERHELVVPDRQGHYDRVAVERVRICWSMHHSLGVNLEGVEVALNLLERWHDERRRTRELLARLRDELDR